jgi:hypothetical protein
VQDAKKKMKPQRNQIKRVFNSDDDSFNNVAHQIITGQSSLQALATACATIIQSRRLSAPGKRRDPKHAPLAAFLKRLPILLSRPRSAAIHAQHIGKANQPKPCS